MKVSMSLCALLVLGLLLPAYANLEEGKTQSLIVPGKGKVGVFSLRAPVSRYGKALLKDQQSNSYHTADNQYVFKVDDNGKIKEITATAWGLYTDRFIRIKQSTLRDVFAKYGNPQRTRHQNETLYVKYPRIEFFFEGVEQGLLRRERRAELLKTQVAGVTLR